MVGYFAVTNCLVVKKNKVGVPGFTLVEVLIGVVIFLLVSTGVYQGYTSILRIVSGARTKTDAMLLADEQIEVIRNLPYSGVGIVGGLPSGSIPYQQTLVRGGGTFTVTASVRNIDDPFDGTIGGTPNDLSPADYKQVELDITCARCKNFPGYTIRTTVAPKNLETASGNGALFVNVFDASGNPVSGADVHIVNSLLSPSVTINEVTNNSGVFQLVDAPPSNVSYQVRASKSGYSTSQTYATSTANPNPISPHATVLASRVTAMSFSIDRLSDLTVHSVSAACSPIGNIAFSLTGAKTIGSNPIVYKYQQNLTTSSNGLLALPGLEWDSYSFNLAGSSNVLLGSLPLLPLSLLPGTAQDAYLVVGVNHPNSLLVTVRDTSTKLPLADSTVVLSSGSFSSDLITNRGFFNQSDWSGGDGQILYSNTNQFTSSDGNVDTGTSPGDLRLRFALGQYAATGNLISSLFDTGATSTSYYTLSWNPGSQATSTGEESIKVQLASGNDPATTTWNFVGPDGTTASFYTDSGSPVWSGHTGDRYIRYKLFLSTADQTKSPIISSLALTFSSACTPFGQVFFDSLSTGSYSLVISHTGYQTLTMPVTVGSGANQTTVDLNPQ